MEGDTETRECQCGGAIFERVVVNKADGSLYATEFVACAHCRVMYHRPARPPGRPRSDEPSVDDWAARYRKSVRR